MAVLREDTGDVVGFEMRGKLQDVGETLVGHGSEDDLHVDDEKGGLHVEGLPVWRIWLSNEIRFIEDDHKDAVA